MAFDSALAPSAIEALENIGPLDIVVGIPSYRNAETIAHVVTMVGEGLATHFPGRRSAIVNADGGSPDDTRTVFMQPDLAPDVARLSFEYRGPAGKGTAVRAILEATRMSRSSVCVLLDSDLRSITPEWVQRLAGPVVEGDYDYIAPFYTRHKYDGTITNNIAYPLTRALYGVDIRQPIGGDFAFSGRLAELYLANNAWDSDVARFGIDIALTTEAIASGARIGQAALGLKIHDARDPAASLGPMFRQVVGTLFGLMVTFEHLWRGAERVQNAPVIGQSPAGEPEPVNVLTAALAAKLKDGAQAHGTLWREVLAEQNWDELQQVLEHQAGHVHFPAELWVRIVYDFALAFRTRGGEARASLLEALIPLYFGRTAGFVMETATMTSADAEQVVARQADTYLDLKPYLLERWK